MRRSPLAPLRLVHLLALLARLVAVFALGAGACQTVPVDTGSGSRLIAPSGVIEGSVLYQGPHPCSANGHIVGNLVLLFFYANDPPPPAGIASTAVNFGVVSGDVLFQNEPRAAGARYCPKDAGHPETITASAPFAVSPFGPGAYIIEAFFDYEGAFLPTFKFRNLPELGDVGGGYIDTTDALLHADAGVDYRPIFLPVTVGVPASSIDAGLDGAGVGLDGTPLALPASGYVANNVAVTVGSVLPIPRPYFYVDQATAPAPASMATPANPSGNPDYVPAQTMAQDIHILAPPPNSAISPATITAFQQSLGSVKLLAGVPPAELAAATSPTGPFQFQLSPDPLAAAKSLFLWTDGKTIPESPLLSNLFPQVVFTRLVDDPDHTKDPQSLAQQVPPAGPVVVLLGITLGPTDSLLELVGYPNTAPGPAAATDHVTALVRPVALCLDPTRPDLGATLVAPFFTGTSADPNTMGDQPLFDPTSVIAALQPIFGTINPPVQGCLPPGRYAPNLVYPTGQAWTVPNESGSCAASEGKLQVSAASAQCTGGSGTSRPALYSQGTRAVLEVTKSVDSAVCASNPVPSACGGP